MVKVSPSGMPPSLPRTKETATSPAETLRQSLSDPAVGLGVYARKVEGFTPSVCTRLPSSVTSAASARSTDRTPWSVVIFATTAGLSGLFATMNRCGRRIAVSGATGGGAAACVGRVSTRAVLCASHGLGGPGGAWTTTDRRRATASELRP